MTLPRRKRLIPGHSVYLRVNPTECLQIIDFLKNAGIDPAGRTFGSCVSIVWHALMKDAHQRGFMRNVDGFQYTEQMAQFLPPEDLVERHLNMEQNLEQPEEDPQEVAQAQEDLQELIDWEDKGNILSEQQVAEKQRLTKIVLGI